jgi:hypothetical protein
VGGGRGRKRVGKGKGERNGRGEEGRGGEEGEGSDPPNFETVVAPLSLTLVARVNRHTRCT